MDLNDINTDEPPPPPYSQQELDAKVDLARQVSIVQHRADEQTRRERRQNNVSGEYPTSNQSGPAMVNQQRQASSLSTQRRPLPIPQAYGSSSQTHIPQLNNSSIKEYPSWYNDAQLSSSQSSSMGNPEQSTSSPRSSYFDSNVSQFHDVAGSLSQMGVSDVHESSNPPQFAASGPSLDGPAYRETDDDHADPSPVSDPQQGHRVQPAFTDSEPPSPLNSASDPPSDISRVAATRSTSLSPPPIRENFQSLPNQNHHMSMPPQPVQPIDNRINPPAPPRAMSAYIPSPNPPLSTLNWPHAAFEPMSAYQQMGSGPPRQLRQDIPSQHVIDPSAFYNSSVSSMISANVPSRLRSPQLPQGISTNRPLRGVNPQAQFNPYSPADAYQQQSFFNPSVAPYGTVSQRNPQPLQQSRVPLPPPGAQTGINPQYRTTPYGNWST